MYYIQIWENKTNNLTPLPHHRKISNWISMILKYGPGLLLFWLTSFFCFCCSSDCRVLSLCLTCISDTFLWLWLCEGFSLCLVCSSFSSARETDFLPSVPRWESSVSVSFCPTVSFYKENKFFENIIFNSQKKSPKDRKNLFYLSPCRTVFIVNI